MILITINIITLFFQTMLYMTRPTVTLYASDLGASALDIGLLTATYSFLPLFLAIYIGKISDRVGDRLPIIISTIGLSVGLALPYLFGSMLAFYLSQTIVGIANILVNISLQNVLGHVSTPQTRDHYFGIFTMMAALAAVIGPVAGGYLGENFSYPLVFLVALLIGLIPFAFSYLIPNKWGSKEQSPVMESDSNPLTLLKLPAIRSALISSALVLYSKDIFIAYFPLYASQINISTSAIGWIIAIQGMAMVAVRFYLGQLVDRFGRSRILLTSILLAGVAFLFMPITNRLYIVGFLSALVGLGLGCGQPLSMTTAYNASPKTRTGEVLGLRMASNCLSQFIAPVFFGVIGAWAGLVSIFYISGVFLIGGAFLSRSDSLVRHREFKKTSHYKH